MDGPVGGRILLLLALVAAAPLGGCNKNAGSDSANGKSPSARIGGDDAVANGAAPTAGSDTILIASFNIQVFGEAKLDKKPVVEVLARTIRLFDVIAIQEIRSANQDVLPEFLRYVNADGAKYDYVLGPRLGRSSSKEQYAYVFNTERVEVSRRSVYTVDDPHDLLHREPLVARFRARGAPAEEAFTFTLVNIHTDPDETDLELNVLDDVLRAVQNDGVGEDDIILLGDLNADDRHLGELSRVPGIAWAISGQTTNTRGTQGYDNIIFFRRRTAEHTGRSGVVNLMTEFRLSPEDALDVSDHFPVWAEFRVREAETERFAESPRNTRRP